MDVNKAIEILNTQVKDIHCRIDKYNNPEHYYQPAMQAVEILIEEYRKLKDAMKITLNHLEVMHHMNPEEPCNIYEDWVSANKLIESEKTDEM